MSMVWSGDPAGRSFRRLSWAEESAQEGREKGQSRSMWEGEGSVSMDGSSSVSGVVTPFLEAGGSEGRVFTQET